MRTPRVLAVVASMMVLFSACSTGGGTSPSAAAPSTAASQSTAPASTEASAAAKAPIKIGSDNFYESKLVGEIYAQVLEHAGMTGQGHGPHQRLAALGRGTGVAVFHLVDDLL